jgi:hypothetical protein
VAFEFPLSLHPPRPVIQSEAAMIRDTSPDHVSSVQWTEAMGVARQVCARIFRDGGQPADALTAFGLDADADVVEWDKAVSRVATEICAKPMRRAA